MILHVTARCMTELMTKVESLLMKDLSCPHVWGETPDGRAPEWGEANRHSKRDPVVLEKITGSAFRWSDVGGSYKNCWLNPAWELRRG